MVSTYPVSLTDLWIEKDDTDGGVKIVSASNSKSSRRIFERLNSGGVPSQYYEYRDTAMSKMAPFRPEWIRQLRIVSDADPNNNDVAYNHGHLMHQMTFFVGPVNFYWEVGETQHCAELDTGDSNYITPFVPHSFTSRVSNNLGLIIAVTYGGAVRRALDEFRHIKPEDAESLVADPRRKDRVFAKLLARYAASESMSTGQLLERLILAGIPKARACSLMGEGEPTSEEIERIANALHLRPADITVAPMKLEEEVVVHKRSQIGRLYPDDSEPSYEFRELARTKHQPDVKGLDVSVIGNGRSEIRHGLHEYIYNYGEAPVTMYWGNNRTALLAPGDSAYVKPLIKHSFEKIDSNTGKLVMIRVPGGLNGSVLDEFSTFSPMGRSRVIEESKRWF